MRTSERCFETEPGTDTGAYTCNRAWRTICQYRARMQLTDGDQNGKKLADYADHRSRIRRRLRAEKFLDIKCRMAGIKPDAVVIVATVRALKYNGGVAKPDLNEENLEALENGIPNLMKHVDNIKNVYGLPCVVAINAFPTDTKAELDLVEEKCKEVGVNVALSEVWAKGGEGGLKLAEEVVRLCEEPGDFHYAYELEGTIEDKLDQIVQKIYGG